MSLCFANILPLIKLIAKGDSLPKLAAGQLPLQLGIIVPIHLSVFRPAKKRPIISPALNSSNFDTGNDRFVVTFSDGEEIYFKVEKLLHNNNTFVLDTELTTRVLVGEILLPPNGVAYLLHNVSFFPQNGKGMHIWRSPQHNMHYACRSTIRKKRKIVMFGDVPLVDS